MQRCSCYAPEGSFLMQLAAWGRSTVGCARSCRVLGRGAIGCGRAGLQGMSAAGTAQYCAVLNSAPAALT